MKSGGGSKEAVSEQDGKLTTDARTTDLSSRRNEALSLFRFLVGVQ